MCICVYMIVILYYNALLAWGLGEGLTTPHRKKKLVRKYYTGPWNWRALVSTVMNLPVP